MSEKADDSAERIAGEVFALCEEGSPKMEAIFKETSADLVGGFVGSAETQARNHKRLSRFKLDILNS